jgi:hypothetical protein
MLVAGRAETNISFLNGKPQRGGMWLFFTCRPDGAQNTAHKKAPAAFALPGLTLTITYLKQRLSLHFINAP